MSHDLKYGTSAMLQFDLPHGVLVAACGATRHEPAEAVDAALRAGLDRPLDFPALNQACVPGDRVVLALEPGVPQGEVVVRAIAEYLVEGRIEAGDLTILRTATDPAILEDPRRLLPATWRDQVQVAVHDPHAHEQLGYLAALGDGIPVKLHRSLVEADLVVPVGCLSCHAAWQPSGMYVALFPTFSNTATLDRFRRAATRQGPPKDPKRARREIDEAGWLLGVQFTVDALPAGGDMLAEAVAGAANMVFAAGQASRLARWHYQAPRRADLVVAALEGALAQTWENVARALSSACAAVAPGGTIALCTELEAQPGPSVRHLAECDDRDLALKHIRRECPVDAPVAIELARALETAKVYLVSRLDESLVESLGMVPVAPAADIARLASRQPSCTLIANAQYSTVSVEDD